MRILITGTAGFIGFHLTQQLAKRGDDVVGLDNINNYYDTQLKKDRLQALGLEPGNLSDNSYIKSNVYPNLRFIKSDINQREAIEQIIKENNFDCICHLAAQAGVRYSIENPFAYVESNVTGFLSILEACRNHNTPHLVYASSSSVYGKSRNVPYKESEQVDAPESLYAATKKADELMAHAYSGLYQLHTTGVRFFTVYGPWGRPDMAPFLFLDAIMKGQPIKVFNQGNMHRDFTYIDDIIKGLIKIIDQKPQGDPYYKIYNIGNGKPVNLLDFIKTIEKISGKTAEKKLFPMQPGDVYQTHADTSLLEKEVGYKPSVSIDEGIKDFYHWYCQYNNL